MDLQPSEEQAQLRDAVERYIRDACGFEARRAAQEAGGLGDQHWRRFAELGWLAIPFAEEDGGLDGGPVEVGIVMEGLGLGLALEPVLATWLAGWLIAEVGTPEQKATWLLPAIAGAKRLSLAYAEPGGRYDPAFCSTRAEKSGDGWRLNGRKSVALGGRTADGFVVTARTEGGLSLFLLPTETTGLQVRRYATHDGQGAADLTLEGVALGPEALLGDPGAALPELERVLDRAVAATACEAVGCIRALSDQTLEHLKTRKQFGRPLSDNQALQHRMADMIVAREEARSAALAACLAVEQPDPAARARQISLAKIEIARTATKVGQEAVQLHGAMGMTWDLPVGHHFKRLTAIALSFGDADHHLRRIARLDAEARQAPERA